MTVLLMLCMIVAFLAADKVVRGLRASKERRLAMGEGTLLSGPPEGVRLALNHSWMRMEKGVAVIGFDEFIARMLGAVESVVVPVIGATVAPGTPDIALAHGNRRVRFASPVAGRVLEINRALVETPAIVRRDPYRGGWLLKISPDPNGVPAAGSLTGAAAREWLGDQISLAKEFLTGVAPRPSLATLPDGGEPAEGVLLHCDAAAWEEFERRFTTIHAPKPETT